MKALFLLLRRWLRRRPIDTLLAEADRALEDLGSTADIERAARLLAGPPPISASEQLGDLAEAATMTADDKEPTTAQLLEEEYNRRASGCRTKRVLYRFVKTSSAQNDHLVVGSVNRGVVTSWRNN